MLSNYLRKQAVSVVEAATATSGIAKDVFLAAAATAALAGIGTGYATSRLTSPRPVDSDNEKKQYLLTDMRLRLAKYNKEKKLAEQEQPQEISGKPPREIRL